MMVVVMKSLSQDIEESQRECALKHFPMPTVQEERYAYTLSKLLKHIYFKDEDRFKTLILPRGKVS